jgi:hypothetical protein
MGYFRKFQKKLSKVNNRPIGENSPKLVTVVISIFITDILLEKNEIKILTRGFLNSIE